MKKILTFFLVFVFLNLLGCNDQSNYRKIHLKFVISTFIEDTTDFTNIKYGRIYFNEQLVLNPKMEDRGSKFIRDFRKWGRLYWSTYDTIIRINPAIRVRNIRLSTPSFDTTFACNLDTASYVVFGNQIIETSVSAGIRVYKDTSSARIIFENFMKKYRDEFQSM